MRRFAVSQKLPREIGLSRRVRDVSTPLPPQRAVGKSAAPGFTHDFSRIAVHASEREDQAANGIGLSGRLKSGLETLGGVDLSGVRVHPSSSKPAHLHASAFTEGHDIYLGPGEEKHLAHEGWHVVQQMQGRVRPTVQAGAVAMNDDAALEREADLMASKATSLDPAPSAAVPRSERGVHRHEVAQRKLQITGLDDTKRKKFVTKMSEDSPVTFELDAGVVKRKDATAKATDEYSKQITAAIDDAQSVALALVKQDDTIFGDSFASGQVDYDDMMGMSSVLFRSNVMHFVVERFSIKDYETNKATASREDFLKAHKKGQEAQEKQLKELYPKKTIKYIGQGYDESSKVVDKDGNGSIDYYFDFTDVKQVFKQNVVAGAVKESIISSKIVIVR